MGSRKYRLVTIHVIKIGGISLNAHLCTCTRDKPPSLVSSRKQGLIKSCETCGGGMLDGLGTKGSVSMMSTLGLDLLNFINPNLTWKTVAKGYRSNSRRKPACRKFAMEKFLSDKGAREVDDVTISDTEKLGVDILGRHFSEKVEQVPIKKRRFAAGSLSPPKQNAASRYKVIEPSCHSKRQRRTTDGSIPSKFAQNLTDVAIKNKFDYSEDFSGIEILAAVACDNGMVNDTDANISLKKESTSTPVLFCRKDMDYPKDVPIEDKIEVSPVDYDAVTNSQKSPSTKGDASVDVSISSRVHWDLNVTMDAWEKPCIPTVDPPAESDSTPNIEKKQGSFNQGEPGDIKQNLSEGLKDLPAYKSNLEGDSYEESPGLADNHDECPADYTEKPSVCDVDDRKASDQLGHVDACLDDSCREAPEHTGEALPPLLNLMQSMEACVLDVHLREILFEKAEAQVDTSNAASQSALDVEVNHEIDCVTSKGDEHLCQQEAYVSLGVEPGNSANDVGNLCLSPAQGSTAASGAAALEGKPIVTVTAEGLADEASPTDTAEVDSPVHNGSEELMQKSSVDSTATHSEAFGTCCNRPFSSTAKAITEDPSDDNCESDVYQADKLQAVGGEDINGYDSQFEDGELRESDARYCWDENEDYADYASEGEDERLCGMGNEKEKKAVEELDRGPSERDHCGKGDAQRDDSESPKTRTSDVTTDKNFPSVVSGSRASNRESFSCRGRHDGIRGKDAVLSGRVENGSICYRDEREASSRKFTGVDRAYIRGKSSGGRLFVNPSVGYWDSDRRSSPPHRGRYSSGPPRPKSVLENRGYMMASNHKDPEVSDFTGFDNHSRRHLINHSTIGHYERFVKRTPTGRDDGYGMRRAMLPNRDLSPGRNRFGSYYQGIGRGKRDEFCSRSIPEDSIEHPNRHRLARRERSISPHRRGRPLYTYSYRKSSSRSRSRSPSGYMPLRERNDNPRLLSRSPGFRSNSRTERMRMPFQKRLPADYDEGVMSPPRGHFSPQHNSRCFDERNGALDSFRGRKSPVRMFRQGQRFDSGHSLRRFNADAQFRPMLHSRKFPDAGAGGRGGEYERSGDDDQRKGRDRYEMVHRVRRYSSDGFVRRFRYNVEDSLVDSDSHNFDNASDRRLRDMPNRASEEA